MSRVCAVGAACVFPGVVSASLHAVTFDTIWSSEVRAIHSSRARLRLTHLCRADQPIHVRTVVSSTLEISPVAVVRDFRFACPGWPLIHLKGRRAHETLVVAHSSSSRGRHLSPR